mmetsp:Transcript_66809/g.150914  ORF Transcript_66809/g.150914 Transcript_66809/m.150914 type:complete len:218 (+) Transcript_66809:1959-2612(+)
MVARVDLLLRVVPLRLHLAQRLGRLCDFVGQALVVGVLVLDTLELELLHDLRHVLRPALVGDLLSHVGTEGFEEHVLGHLTHVVSQAYLPVGDREDDVVPGLVGLLRSLLRKAETACACHFPSSKTHGPSTSAAKNPAWTSHSDLEPLGPTSKSAAAEDLLVANESAGREKRSSDSSPDLFSIIRVALFSPILPANSDSKRTSHSSIIPEASNRHSS